MKKIVVEEVVVEIECGDKYCGQCRMFDFTRQHYCDVFLDYPKFDTDSLDTDHEGFMRLPECIAAQVKETADSDQKTIFGMTKEQINDYVDHTVAEMQMGVEGGKP